jgi:P pilus assembly chaperone PapD
MPKLNWSVSIQVSGGPNLTITAPSEEVEAIDRVTVDLEPGETVLDLQPGSKGQIRLLVIESSIYDDELTFWLREGTTQWPASGAGVPLNHGPQIYAASTGGLLEVDPKQLTVSNNTTSIVRLSIFVARDAITRTPTP